MSVLKALNSCLLCKKKNLLFLCIYRKNTNKSHPPWQDRLGGRRWHRFIYNTCNLKCKWIQLENVFSLFTDLDCWIQIKSPWYCFGSSNLTVQNELAEKSTLHRDRAVVSWREPAYTCPLWILSSLAGGIFDEKKWKNKSDAEHRLTG